MKKFIAIFGAIGLVIGLPICFKQTQEGNQKHADDVLIVITPSNESIRFEIGLGFQKWYRARTGRTVRIDWRVPGSTGEVIRYVDSIFVNAFRVHWEKDLHQIWTPEVQANFTNLSVPANHPARQAFLHSNVSCGIDVMFGGGVMEFKREADMGNFVDSGVVAKHPEWFCDKVIPHELAGDQLWDGQGRWIGSSLSSFGIVYNIDRVIDLGIRRFPQQWSDLTDPKLFRQIAMVDPVLSSVVVKCFEMMIQQQMYLLWKEKTKESKMPADALSNLSDEALHEILSEGWLRGLKMVQKIMANSRYFTDNSVSTIWDVSMGNCAAGVVVDFYGRYQRDVLRTQCQSNRLAFVMPKGGSAVSPDPIAMFRGAPHPKLAADFIEYVISEEGQDLIGLKVGAPHGPKVYPLSRTPMRKDFYTEEKRPYMLSPEMNPFLETSDFTYHPNWTAPAFQAIRFLSKVLFMDPYTEMAQAWEAIIKAEKEGRKKTAKKALAIFENLQIISYDWVLNTLRPLLRSKKPLEEIALSTKLTRDFREQYLKAYAVAREESR